MKLTTEAYTEHQTAGAQPIRRAVAAAQMIVGGACTCCQGCSSCSCCAAVNLAHRSL